MSPPKDPSSAEEPREVGEIERGAVQGVALLLGRSIGVQLLTAGATIALARLLTPADYGAFAIAMAIQLLGRTVVDFGLPLALIQRPRAPTVSELRAVTGFMVAVGAAVWALVALVVVVALPLAGIDSELSLIVGVACCALPLYGLRVVPVILVERRLQFGRLALIEVCETLAFYLFAVPAAVAGFGAFSMAIGVPVSAAAGGLAAYLVRPWRFGMHLQLSAIRPLASFGARVSLMGPAHLVRELGIVGLLAATSGQAVAGFYSLAQRLFSIPIAIISAVYKVSTAALARGEVGSARARRAARAVGVTAVAAGLPLTLAVGAADPLVAVLFGDRWLPAADVVAAAAPGIFLTSAGTVLVGLALADGDASSPLLSAVTGSIVSVAATVPLTAALDEVGAGLASTIGLTAGIVVLLTRLDAVARSSAVPALRALAVVAGASLIGRVAGGGTDAFELVLALTASGASWLALSFLITRADLLALIELVRRHAIGGLRARRRPRDEDALLDQIAEADTAGV